VYNKYGVSNTKIKKISKFKFLVEKTGKMRVPVLLYSPDNLIKLIGKDKALEQLINVATLPGIVKYALGMPDMHQGYAFPIGGVAAFDIESGVVSPGGVGFDINCGVRVIKTNLSYKEVRGQLNKLGNILFANIPAGVGSEGKEKFGSEETKTAMRIGIAWAKNKGFAWKEDEDATEENGRMKNADPAFVSKRAIDRGKVELGTLGAGNHFLEIDRVSKIYNETVAKQFGLFKDQILIWIHTGSRGLGHQVATDYLKIMRPRMEKYGLPLIDPDFVSLPLSAPESDMYLKAMASAANFAWVNRQILTYLARLYFTSVFNESPEKLGMYLLYDVAHNIAKFEKYKINGKEKLLLVHRKGATRSFPKGHPDLRGLYREIGQPVLLPGDMKRGSYILVGNEKSLSETFGSVAHGAGRLLSRHKAVKTLTLEHVQKEMDEKNIILHAKTRRIIMEEAPEAYKDVHEVVKPIIGEQLAELVAHSEPLFVLKG